MNIGAKITDYLITAQAELKKVVWPTKKDTFRFSLAVIVVSLAVAAFLGILDFIFNLGLEKLILPS
ncbi:MAG: preprotein translocase subunit SecE [Patescibacteria group bacterium]